jgi:hypothetical protein
MEGKSLRWNRVMRAYPEVHNDGVKESKSVKPLSSKCRKSGMFNKNEI